jgi:hypothetical protein
MNNGVLDNIRSFGDHYDSAVGYRKPTFPVGFSVPTDTSSGMYSTLFINNGPSDHSAGLNDDIIKDNRFLYRGIPFHNYTGRNHRIPDAGSADDSSF